MIETKLERPGHETLPERTVNQGTLEGYLQDDGTVKFQVRDPATTHPRPGTEDRFAPEFHDPPSLHLMELRRQLPLRSH